jgi:hypothetical protein
MSDVHSNSPAARWRLVTTMFATMAMVCGLAACAVGGGDESFGEPDRRVRRTAGAEATRDRVVSAVSDAHQASSGRYRLEAELGGEGVFVSTISLTGAFDRASGASEVSLDMRSLFESYPDDAGVSLPDELGDELIIRIVDGLLYQYVGSHDREWIVYPLDPSEVLDAMGIYRPEMFLEVIESSSHDVSVADGPTIDAVPTRHYSGWIDGTGFAGLSSDGSGGGLGQMAASFPPGLLDRIVRFDAWVGADGLLRRVVIEFDHDAMFEVAERIEGPQDRTRAMPVMHYRIDWFDLDEPVGIEPPAPHLVQVVDIDAMRSGEWVGP